MTDETRELDRVAGRRLRWRTAVSLAALFVAFAALAFAGTSYVQRAEQQQQRADAEQGRAQQAETAVDLLCAQVERLGRRCVVEPEELTGQPVPPTEAQLRPLVRQYVDEWLAANPPPPGRDAPSLAELTDVIVTEVAAELERNPPPPGEDGEPGGSPTPEQLRPIVVEAVSEHLAATPPPPGQPGQDGEDGADSTVPGPPGEPPLEWTFTTTDALGRETAHQCVREEPFDPDAPRYECEPVEDEE